MLAEWTRWALNPESFGYEPTAFSPIYATSPLNQHKNKIGCFFLPLLCAIEPKPSNRDTTKYTVPNALPRASYTIDEARN